MTSSELPNRDQGTQATEKAWREIADEFGLLTSAEVAGLLGPRHESQGGSLIRLRQADSLLYPGFQFDRSKGEVLPIVPKLLKVAEKYGKTQEGLAQWLCAGTDQLNGDRPVDHLREVNLVLEAAENHYGVEW